MPQAGSFLDVTVRRMDLVSVFRRTARANRLNAQAAALTRSQRPRRVAAFTPPPTVGAASGSPSPINAVTDLTGGVQLTLAENQVRDLPPTDLAEPK
jgi:hypothetical protein